MADEKAETSGGPETSTKPVVDLLSAILEEFKKQVQSKTAPPLVGDALIAVEAFKEISEALDVKKAQSAFSTAPKGDKVCSAGLQNS